MSLPLSLLRDIPYMDAVGFDKARRRTLTGVSTDSRTIGNGQVFIALRGERFNGHNFVSTALQSGASALVVDALWAKANTTMVSSCPVPVVIVEDTTKALADLGRAHRRAWGGKLVAIAGSNGKTSTKEMVRAVLSAKYTVLATEGNYNNHIGVPLTLLQLTDRHDMAVVELGTNHPGEIPQLCAIAEPTHGLVTNIGREHLEHFGSVKGVAKEEGSLIDWVKEHGGTALLNLDDRHLAASSRGLRRKMTYAFGRSADVRGSAKTMDGSGCASFTMRKKGQRPVDIALRTPGARMAENALAAAAAGFALSVPASGIVRALERFQAASKRMQTVQLSGVTVLNDTYNANPDSVVAALETLSAIETAGKRIAVLADMLELGGAAERAHRDIGRSLRRYRVDYLLAYGPFSRYTVDASTARMSLHYEQKNILAQYLLELLSDGDVVLVKGSRGMKMEDVVTFITESMSRAA